MALLGISDGVSRALCFGPFVARQSWRTLAAGYDLARGRLWPLVLAAVGTAPAAARAARLRGGARRRQA
jgi:hypothetical protein